MEGALLISKGRLKMHNTYHVKVDILVCIYWFVMRFVKLNCQSKYFELTLYHVYNEWVLPVEMCIQGTDVSTNSMTTNIVDNFCASADQ